MGEEVDSGEGWEKVGPGLVPEKCNLQYLLPPLAPQVRLLGHSPVLRNITNAQAPGSWKKSEAPDQTAHSSEEDKENVRFPQARMGTLPGEKGARWGGSLAFDDATAPRPQDGFVFKMPWKPTHPNHAHALAEWANRREAFAQRPSSAPDLMVRRES